MDLCTFTYTNDINPAAMAIAISPSTIVTSLNDSRTRSNAHGPANDCSTRGRLLRITLAFTADPLTDGSSHFIDDHRDDLAL